MEPEATKPASRSKTVIGLAVFALNGIAAGLGLELDFSFILDGITVHEIIDFVSAVLVVIGLRTAERPLTVFGKTVG